MRVLILGGYGFFGTLLVRRLIQNPQLQIVIAGRQLEKAHKLASTLTEYPAQVTTISLNATHFSELRQALISIAPDVVVNTCGPFQSRDYSVAKACIDEGCHYIDLADGRDFVAHIDQLHDDATRKNVLVISGASSVPALSSAVVDKLASDFAVVEDIDIGISPGNKTDRGLATVAGILSYCGAPINIWRDSKPAIVYGWFGAIRYKFPDPVGVRWLSDCDVPDLELFPQRYHSVKSVRFRAGLELPLLQGGMVVMSALRRLGCITNWSRYALPLKNASEWFRLFGSDHGGMYVRVKGVTREGKEICVHWTLVAKAGDGPYVPVLASAALIRKMMAGTLLQRGAMPCMGLLSLEDFLLEASGLNIATTVNKVTG